MTISQTTAGQWLATNLAARLGAQKYKKFSTSKKSEKVYRLPKSPGYNRGRFDL
jgi:hypothetical protein